MINLTKIVAAVLVLLGLALGGYAWMLSRKPAPVIPAKPASQGQTQSDAPLFPVVVTTKAVPAGQPIAADALRVAQLPINPAGAVRETAAAAGRVPVLDLGEGTPLLESQLVSGLALRLGEGERAIAVKADEVMGVGNRIRPGDLVDVFFVLKSDGKEIDRSQVRLLLARKRVLAYGSASVDGQPSSAGANGQSGGGAQAARTAVLAVPVDEVNRLALGDTSGRLLLALRHPADTKEPDPALFAALPTALQPASLKAGEPRGASLKGLDQAQAGLAVADLASGGQGGARAGALPATARAPASRYGPAAGPRRQGGTEVEVIRGDKRETLQY
jgi:pilus assembly protein CpaB